MKELSIEEKAERYNEALIVAKQWYNDSDTNKKEKYLLKGMFPELKESEGEKWIPKEIAKYLKEKGGFRSCWLAWLEKQGKNNMGISEATKKKLEDNLNNALEKETPESWNKFLDEQGEQKPADKVEPKFRVGDTIKCKYDYRQFTIKSVDLDKGTYTYTQEGCGNDIDYADEEFELVEQKPAWSEEDERYINIAVSAFSSPSLERLYHYNKVKSNDLINWLKSLKDRIQSKLEWSEEGEVVALLGNGKVGFAHRPPEYWDGKNIITGKVTRNYPKTYDKGGWNAPNVKWWLDVDKLPNVED